MSVENEPTLTEDALTASLDQLIKAAGAESAVANLRKGGIVNSGFEDERGKQGGGQASMSDAGGLEDMMIGKLVGAGLSGDQAQSAVATMFGFLSESGMLGRQEGEDEDEDEDDEDEDEGEGENMTAYARGYYDAMQKMGKSTDESSSGEPLHKSFAEQFNEDGDIGPAVDASPFLEALTARTTASLDALAKSVAAGRNKQTAVNKAMAAAVYQLGTLVKSQERVIQELGGRLGVVERTPATQPRGARTAPQAQAMAKSMDGGGGGGGERLTKSQAASVFSYLRFEKGMQTIEGEPTGQLAIMAESGGSVSKGAYEYAQKYLATHPNERQAALSYR